jgi:hypothetical protein
MNASLAAPFILWILEAHCNSPPYVRACRQIAHNEPDLHPALFSQCASVPGFVFFLRIAVDSNADATPDDHGLCPRMFSTKLSAKCHLSVNRWSLCERILWREIHHSCSRLQDL